MNYEYGYTVIKNNTIYNFVHLDEILSKELNFNRFYIAGTKKSELSSGKVTCHVAITSS